MLQTEQTDVGVIIGRFQVPELHAGHQELIDSVLVNHHRVIVVLGMGHTKCSFRNPLDVGARRSMFREQYPDITCLYIKDMQTNEAWSAKLDEIIHDEVAPESTVTLYGSRDSFVESYTGAYNTIELKQKTYVSGTSIRKQLAHNAKKDKQFRVGCCFAVANQWPGPETTIDVAIFNKKNDQILLGRKIDEEGWRVIGGFVQNEETLEECVLREGKEETGLDLAYPEYVGSFVSDDWRKMGERDKILTVLFKASVAKGRPAPDDDIHELQWFDLNGDLFHIVISNHRVLIEAVLGKYVSGAS